MLIYEQLMSGVYKVKKIFEEKKVFFFFFFLNKWSIPLEGYLNFFFIFIKMLT
jgi:hypothetical protein